MTDLCILSVSNPFSFFVLAYEVTKILRNSSFIFFIIFHILYFCTVDAKTEHMELKISKPTLGVLVALTKNELTNM
jgi:hypothetical protein